MKEMFLHSVKVSNRRNKCSKEGKRGVSGERERRMMGGSTSTRNSSKEDVPRTYYLRAGH